MKETLGCRPFIPQSYRPRLFASAVHSASTPAAPAPVALAQSDMIDGQVTKIDEPAGKITIKHGPIRKLDMDEGMTMVFRAQDRRCSRDLRPATSDI